MKKTKLDKWYDIVAVNWVCPYCDHENDMPLIAYPDAPTSIYETAVCEKCKNTVGFSDDKVRYA